MAGPPRGPSGDGERPAVEVDLQIESAAGTLREWLRTGAVWLPGQSAEVAVLQRVLLRVMLGAHSSTVDARVVQALPAGLALEIADPTPLERLAEALEGDEEEPVAVDEEGEGAGVDAREDAEDAPATDGKGSLFHRMRALSIEEKKRLSVNANKAQRFFLSRDHVRTLHLYVLLNPNVTPDEVAGFLKFPRYSVEAIRRIAKSPDWMSNRRVRINLVLNPQSPTEITRRVVRRMKDRDLRELERSGGLHAIVAREVKKRRRELREDESSSFRSRGRGSRKKR